MLQLLISKIVNDVLGKTAFQKKEEMPVNCHLKFRIIPPVTACNDHVAAGRKAELLKLVWDEQGKADCCNGFNVIPQVRWWDFHPGSTRQAQSSCSESHFSLPLPVLAHELQQNCLV